MLLEYVLEYVVKLRTRHGKRLSLLYQVRTIKAISINAIQYESVLL